MVNDKIECLLDNNFIFCSVFCCFRETAIGQNANSSISIILVPCSFLFYGTASKTTPNTGHTRSAAVNVVKKIESKEAGCVSPCDGLFRSTRLEKERCVRYLLTSMVDIQALRQSSLLFCCVHRKSTDEAFLMNLVTCRTNVLHQDYFCVMHQECAHAMLFCIQLISHKGKSDCS